MLAAPQATTTTSAANRSSPPSRSTTTSVTAVPPSFVSSSTTLAFVSSVTFGCSSAGRTPSTSASDFAWTRQGKPSQVAQRMHVAERRVRLVEHDPARRVERVVAGRREIVRELLDPRLVGDGGMRVRRARRRLGRVLAAGAVHLVQLLGERVVRLQLVVGDRPGRRDAVVVAELAEVLLAEPVERRAVELRRASDEVVDPRLERLALLVVPGVGRDVAVVHEHVLGRPVLRLARQPVAALEQEDPLARGGEVPRERAAARAGADDDDVVASMRPHGSPLIRSARMIRPAASISARWENACGKLPRWRPVATSNSSA